MSIILILTALTLLIAGAWAGLSVLMLAPLLAALAALASGMPVLAAYTQVFMMAAGGFVVQFFPLFLLGALFAQSGLPARLIPATIALGAFTFTMTALPGTPSIQNAIPTTTFGTTPFAAPGLGLIAAAVMLVLGLGWLRYRARALAGDASPEPLVTPPRTLPLWVALAPILSVAIVTAVMGALVLPALETTYLALPLYGATDLSRVGGLWSVIAALTVALALALALSRPPNLQQTLNQGAESALLPLFNTASLVGFGAVIASLPGFEVLREGLEGISGGHVVVSAALSSGVLAGITGSASGGMSIALDALGPSLVQQAAQQAVDPALLHRVISVATGGLDTLPHNGAIITLLGICGMTHRQAYGDIFVVAVVGPTVACAVIIALGIAFGGF